MSKCLELANTKKAGASDFDHLKAARSCYVCLCAYLSAGLLFVCFVALRPKSTAMVIAGRSVHLTTLFPGQA